MKIKLILLVILLIFIYNISYSTKENFGSDFFHRGKLVDISSHIQKQIAKYRETGKVENFAELGETYKKDLKIKMKGQPLEEYDPDRYVISEYSFKSLKPVKIESPELDTIQGEELAADDFARPVDYTEGKPLAEHLEVSKYDAGSGDLSELNDVYKIQNRKEFIVTTQKLQERGGNVHKYKRKKCDPPSGDVIGFEGY